MKCIQSPGRLLSCRLALRRRQSEHFVQPRTNALFVSRHIINQLKYGISIAEDESPASNAKRVCCFGIHSCPVLGIDDVSEKIVSW
jgi:hypothetical protein